MKVGDEIETYVVRVNDVEGYADAVQEASGRRQGLGGHRGRPWRTRPSWRALSPRRTRAASWCQRQGCAGVRSRLPERPAPRRRPVRAWSKQKVQLRITEVNRARRRVVGSIRCRARTRPGRPPRRRFGPSIEVGKHYTGTVKSMTSYGVFVDIGGVDGMVHISELSWSRIKTPRRGGARWATPWTCTSSPSTPRRRRSPWA